MRYDSKVYLIKKELGAYNPSTGNYSEDVITEKEQMASVTDAGTSETTVIYGELVKNVKVVRLMGSIDEGYNMLRIGSIFYNIDVIKRFRGKYTLYCSEVN